MGGEFIGAPFQSMLVTNGIKSVSNTVKNPQANSIAERMRRVVGDMMRTQSDGTDLSNVADANLFVDTILASAALGLRATVHTALAVSPGAAVFAEKKSVRVRHSAACGQCLSCDFQFPLLRICCCC